MAPTLSALLFAALLTNSTPERMLVLDLNVAEGLQPELGQELQNLLVTHLQATGRYQVASQDDLRSLLDVDQQQQLVGCSEASCITDIGGALGARWMVAGNVGVLGGKRMLTLKLLDVEIAGLDNQLTRKLPDDDGALPKIMQQAAYNLLRMETPKEPTRWYEKWWVWTAAGTVVAASATTTLLLLHSNRRPEGALGKVTF